MTLCPSRVMGWWFNSGDALFTNMVFSPWVASGMAFDVDVRVYVDVYVVFRKMTFPNPMSSVFHAMQY